MWKRKITSVFLLCFMLTAVLCGCVKIKFTSGFNDFAGYKDIAISTDTADLLFGEQKYSYENMFNSKVWTQNIGGMTVGEYVINSVKDIASHIIFLNLMADSMQIRLTEEEERKTALASEEYISLSGGGISFDTVNGFFSMLRRAEKTFYAITDDVNLEVSNDEARLISVQYIFISTMYMDEDGTVKKVSDAEEKSAAKNAERIYSELKAGADMISAAREKSSDKKCSMELGRGQYIKEFEDAAFDLEIGEISNVVKTEYGYYIIKCINDNIESNLDLRRQEIIFGRRKEMFAGEYEKFISGKAVRFNDEYIKKLSMENIKTGSGSLFDTYKKYFVSTQIK